MSKLINPKLADMGGQRGRKTRDLQQEQCGSSGRHNDHSASADHVKYCKQNLQRLILFIAGLACVIGLERTFRFFFQTHKAKATCCFFGGIIVVLFGWPLVGMIFETYGFFLLFSGFFPAAINFLRRVPLLGTVLNFPGIRTVIDRLAGDSSRTTSDLSVRVVGCSVLVWFLDPPREVGGDWSATVALVISLARCEQHWAYKTDVNNNIIEETYRIHLLTRLVWNNGSSPRDEHSLSRPNRTLREPEAWQSERLLAWPGMRNGESPC
uniref:(California timema) hypothetical protein n=1 Tax=Timema californicum TaxID=61474 RepID=A0A7R9P522_TIMCA|nr:unnamed protein product [Timema californicum]